MPLGHSTTRTDKGVHENPNMSAPNRAHADRKSTFRKGDSL